MRFPVIPWFCAALVPCFPSPAVAASEWVPNGIPAHSAGDLVLGDTDLVAAGSLVYVVSRRGTNAASPVGWIEVQKFDKCGNKLWGVNGVQVTASDISGEGLDIVAADGGGVLVAWGQSDDIHVQRLDLDGSILWTAGGVRVSTAPEADLQPRLFARAGGGVDVVWSRSPWIYAQRLLSDGSESWTPGGMRVTGNTEAEMLVEAVDFLGAPGILYAMADSGGFGYYELFVQRVAPVPPWGANGISLGSAATDALELTDMGDLAAGTLPAPGLWAAYEVLGGVVRQIRVVRVDENGTLTFSHVEGDSGYDEVGPHIVEVGSEAHLAYTRLVGADSRGIIKVVGPAAGETALGPGPAPVQEPLDIAADGAASVVLWRENRDGTPRLFVARFQSTAPNFPWASAGNGEVVTVILGAQRNAKLAVPFDQPPWSTHLDFYLGWDFNSGNPGSESMLQRFDGETGAFGHPEIKLDTFYDCDGLDEGGCLSIEWIASQLDGAPFEHPRDPVINYSIWRAVDVLPGLPPDPICPQSLAGSPADGSCDWEWVGTVDAGEQPAYFTTVPTTRDVAPGDPALHYFAILAEDAFGGYYVSEPFSAATHDEIPPGEPQELSGVQVGISVELHWLSASGPDVASYNVYRSIGGSRALLIGATGGTSFTDEQPSQAFDNTYFVRAVDDNGNQGPSSNSVSVELNTTGTAGEPGLSSLRVLGPSPNPFAGTAFVSIGLPRPGDVVVEVLDPAGRCVRRDVHHGLASGWHRFALDGRDDAGAPLAGGVYFYRLRANEETVTRKLVISR